MHNSPNFPARQDSRSVFASVDALAEELGISRPSAYAGLRSGTIPSIRIGKRYILPRVAIQEWLRSGQWPPAVVQTTTEPSPANQRSE